MLFVSANEAARRGGIFEISPRLFCSPRRQKHCPDLISYISGLPADDFRVDHPRNCFSFSSTVSLSFLPSSRIHDAELSLCRQMRRPSKKVRLPASYNYNRATAAIYFFPPASRSEISFRSLSRLGHMWNCELTSHSREEFRRRRSSVRPSVRPSVLMANEVVINLGKWTPPQKSPKERETEERERGRRNGWRTFSHFLLLASLLRL